MKAVVPQKAEALFSLSEKQCATEALVQLFLQNEENARNEESKTGEKTTLTFRVIRIGFNRFIADKKYNITTSNVTCNFSDQILDGVNPEEEKKKKEGEEKPKSREEVIDETVAQCKLHRSDNERKEFYFLQTN